MSFDGPVLARRRACLVDVSIFLPSTESTTTPPLPSSSPGPAVDLMDISPLPHKAPVARLGQDQTAVESRPILVSPVDGSRLSSAVTKSNSPLAAPSEPPSRPPPMIECVCSSVAFSLSHSRIEAPPPPPPPPPPRARVDRG